MIYTHKGLTETTMKEWPKVDGQSDFEAILAMEPIMVSKADKERPHPTIKNTSLAKGSLAVYFFAGTMTKLKRAGSNLSERSLLVLDLDDAQGETAETILKRVDEAIGDYSYYVYPSLNFTEEAPRFRLIVEPERPMKETEYLATLRSLEQSLGLELDEATFEWARVMGLPITDNLEQFKAYSQVNITTGPGYPIAAKQEAESQEDDLGFLMDPRLSPGYVDSLLVSLLEETARGIKEGGRNNFFARLYGSLLYAGMGIGEAIQLCIVFNENLTYPPLDEEELFTIIKSITSREEKKRGGKKT